MPKIPCEVTGGCKIGENRITNNTKRYGIFAVLLVELASLFLFSTKDYLLFWYPLLTSTIIFILIYKNYCDRVALKYCQRTIIALKSLSIYFAIGILAILFESVGILYRYYIDYMLLLTAFICVLLTLYQNKK